MKKDNERKIFIVIGKTIMDETVSVNTKHTGERAERLAVVERLIREEDAKVIGIYEVNTGHKNGHEIHVVFNNGCIKIYNKRTKRYITALVGRRGQVVRYGIKPTKTMMNKIKKHIRMGYNYL